jgi:hypothetical protein
MTDENESGPREDASYGQAKHVYQRRKAIDQYKDQLEQGVQIRVELEKAYSAHGKESQVETPGPIAAVLELLSGSNRADLADLSEATAVRHAALKSALTPEREIALRDLETGKGSTLATAKIFRSVPHLLDVLPGVPLVQKVRSLVQRLNAPQEWDRYLEDAYWTIGQTILWIVTRDPWVVDQASNDSGKLREAWAQVVAGDLIDSLNLPRGHVNDAADKLRRRCAGNRMTALDGQNRPIPATEWRHLKIVLDGGNMPHVVYRGQSSNIPPYDEVVFLPAEVQREFPPMEPSEDQDVTAPQRKPSSVPSEVGTIENLLPTRNANWTAPTKLEIVGWPPTTSSAAPVQFDAQAEQRSEALRSLHPTKLDAAAQPHATPPTHATKSPPRRKTGGNKDAHDWEEGRLFFKQVLENRGDPALSANQAEGWRIDGDIWAAISEHLGKRYEKEKRKLKAPDISTVGKKFRSELAKLRSTNRQN